MGQVTFSQIVVSLQELLENGGELWNLVQAICYLLALILGLASAKYLKDVSENRSQGYTKPMMAFAAAVMFAAMPETIGTFMETAFHAAWGDAPLSQIKNPKTDGKNFNAVLTLVSFMGFVFIARGIYLIKQCGDPQRNQQATYGRAIIVLGSGTLALYIDWTLLMLANTFGIDLSNYLNS